MAVQSWLSMLSGLFSPVRLVAGAFVVAVLVLPLYFLVLRTEDNGPVRAASLFSTPPLQGREVGVGIGTGKLAPDFEVSQPDGERVRLSDLRGRAVLINFWAQWCTSCLSEMPEIKALQAERGESSFAVLAVNAGESLSEAQEFIDFLDAPFIYGLDIDLSVADAYGVYGLPLSVFIDSEGVIQGVFIGHANRARLEVLVDAAIAARAAAEAPPALRLISTIPRERILDVRQTGEGSVEYTSRSLRCDPSYCAGEAVAALRGFIGVRRAELDPSSAEPRLLVDYDPAAVTVDRLTSRLVEMLTALNDPVYSQPIEVRETGDR